MVPTWEKVFAVVVADMDAETKWKHKVIPDQSNLTIKSPQSRVTMFSVSASTVAASHVKPFVPRS